MPRTRSATLCRLATAAAPQDPPGSDPQLLRAFLASRCEDAFAELVRRHGPMVFATCRRVLGHAQDAEDAFQAAFIVLARKAGTVRGANLAGWLYGVAVRTARGVRIMRDRRRKHETTVATTPGPAHGIDVPGPSDPGRSPEDQELAALVDEELARLPEYYRLPVVLCELQGRSRKEAASELNIPEGTLSSRLAAARRKLADRLIRRGVTATATAVTAAFAHHVSARVPSELARAAVRPAPLSAVAMGAADGVVKALFVARLKGLVVAVGLTAGLIGGGLLVPAGSGGPAAAADPRPVTPGDPAAALVRQLGDPDFATREAAAKALRTLGASARPALEAGTRDPNPEVAKRAREVLTGIRADARADLAKRFDADGTADFDHPVWQRFKTVAGDDKPARQLFARIIADPERLLQLDKAEADPAGAGSVYAAEVERIHVRVQNLLDRPTTGIPHPSELPWPEAAAAFYLGTYPSSTGKVKDGWKHEGHLFTVSFEDGVKAESGPALKRVFASWLARRDSADTLEHSFHIAAFCDAKETLPFARLVAADRVPRSRELPASVYAAALAAIAQLGAPADLPLFERYFADPAVLAPFELTGINPVGSKTDGTGVVQVRDHALGTAVLLFGGDPAEVGFLMAAKRFAVSSGRPVVARYEPFHFGFLKGDEGSREMAHLKAKAWLAERAEGDKKPPAKGAKVWPHFTKVAGSDKAARELFDQIVSNPKNLELLETAASGGPDLPKLYLARRDELNAAAEKKDPAQPGVSHIVSLPLDDVAGWLLLGTYPGTRVDDGNGPSVYFLDIDLGQRGLADALGKDSPMAKPMRQLVAAWLANRGDEYSALKAGLTLALRHDIPGAAGTARRVVQGPAPKGLLGPDFAAVPRALGVLVIGKYGTKDDLPLLKTQFNDGAQVVAVIREKPGQRRPGYAVPIEGQDVTTQVGDVAVVMAVRLRGGNLKEFGFLWPVTLDGAKDVDPFALGVIGFRSEKDRAAVHQKAREWLDNPKK
ncbi:MAG: sigE 41 [Gemmataceae bacterium]|nr:sigE 41 [Gemmataceae bacterium]